MQNHHYSLSDIENMIPWERDIYLQLLTDQLKQEKEYAEKQRMKHG
jgi:hypothetical protein